MNPQHAAMVTEDFIESKAVIPMHRLTGPGPAGTPADHIQAMHQASVTVMALDPGEMVEF